MKNKFFLTAVLSLVFVVVFNVVFYALMVVHNPTSIWISYAFVHFSYLALIVTGKFVPSKNDVDSYAYPLYTIGRKTQCYL